MIFVGLVVITEAAQHWMSMSSISPNESPLCKVVMMRDCFLFVSDCLTMATSPSTMK